MPNDRELSWIEQRILVLKRFIDSGSTDYIEDLEIIEALKTAREALETAIVRNVPEVEPYLSAIRKIDALG